MQADLWAAVPSSALHRDLVEHALVQTNSVYSSKFKKRLFKNHFCLDTTGMEKMYGIITSSVNCLWYYYRRIKFVSHLYNLTISCGGGECQSLSVTLTLRTSLKDVRGHSNRTSGDIPTGCPAMFYFCIFT